MKTETRIKTVATSATIPMRRVALAAALFGVAVATHTAHAGYAWTGNGADANWSTTANWNTSATGVGTGAWFRYSVEPYTQKTVNFSENTTRWKYVIYEDDGTTEAAPVVFTASDDDIGLSGNTLNIGVDGEDVGDGFLNILKGTYSFTAVNIGSGAANPTSAGWLMLGSDRVPLSGG